ncbi:hypothetical protein [Hellea balneolensis]|uniref:hypothetical protein n=1 Tax=Hellea balneolensis TaxID=287478 RepID=UPI00040D2105|nr:hypothetical protein [Hellea balneolensis]
MRKSICYQIAGTVILSALAVGSAQSQVNNLGSPINDLSSPIILPNSSSSYNQNGFNLPTQPHISGQDMIRGPSGITCQSAIGSNGPKLDMGMIGSNDIFDRETVSFYGRISVPLGKKTKRVDCTKLYDLEISRLKMELQLMRAGAMPGMLDQRAARQVITQLPAAQENSVEQARPSNPLVIGGKAQDTAQVISKPAVTKPAAPEAVVTQHAELAPLENHVTAANIEIREETPAKTDVVRVVEAKVQVLEATDLKSETIKVVNAKASEVKYVQRQNYVMAAEKNLSQSVTSVTTDVIRRKIPHIETVIPRLADRTLIEVKTVSVDAARVIPHIETVIPSLADRTFIKTEMASVSPAKTYQMAKLEKTKFVKAKAKSPQFDMAQFEVIYACNTMTPKFDGAGVALAKNTCGKIFTPKSRAL